MMQFRHVSYVHLRIIQYKSETTEVMGVQSNETAMEGARSQIHELTPVMPTTYLNRTWRGCSNYSMMIIALSPLRWSHRVVIL